MSQTSKINVDSNALDVQLNGYDCTIREFFKRCLLKLWDDLLDFSGKRALGNSDWDGDIIVALIKAGYIEGTVDDDGYANYDPDYASEYVRLLLTNHFFKDDIRFN